MSIVEVGREVAAGVWTDSISMGGHKSTSFRKINVRGYYKITTVVTEYPLFVLYYKSGKIVVI